MVAPGLGVTVFPIVVSKSVIGISLAVVEWVLLNRGVDERGDVIQFFEQTVCLKWVFEVFANVKFIHAFILWDGEQFVRERCCAAGFVAPIVNVAVADVAEPPLYAPGIVHVVR